MGALKFIFNFTINGAECDFLCGESLLGVTSRIVAEISIHYAMQCGHGSDRYQQPLVSARSVP